MTANRAADRIRAVIDDALRLVDAADEITCALDHPEAWSLDFSDAVELRAASNSLRSTLDDYLTPDYHPVTEDHA